VDALVDNYTLLAEGLQARLAQTDASDSVVWVCGTRLRCAATHCDLGLY